MLCLMPCATIPWVISKDFLVEQPKIQPQNPPILRPNKPKPLSLPSGHQFNYKTKSLAIALNYKYSENLAI